MSYIGPYKSRSIIFNVNSSALKENSMEYIPPAPPLPLKFSGQFSSETIKSTDFSKGIKNSITPSGTDLSQSMLIRPSQITDPPPIIRMAPSSSIHKSTLRHRSQFRYPEHIKTTIAQRIEELKHSSLNTKSSTDLLVTCEYNNTDTERNWIDKQMKLNSSIKFNNTNNYLELNHRLFHIQSIEYINQKNFIRFSLRESNFLIKDLKQIIIITILIISLVRLIENILLNLSIPGINFIYIFILITISMIFLTNQNKLPGP